MWVTPYNKRATMMILFNIFQTVGFYSFANWVPTLLIKQGITVTNGLLYSSIIAISAPIGLIIGLLIGDKFERKTVIVVTAAAIVVCGLLFSHMSVGLLLIAMGMCLTREQHHVLQFSRLSDGAFPNRHPDSRSRLCLFLEPFLDHFFIAGILKQFRTTGVFMFIAGTMLIVMVVIGFMGPRTRDLALEKISH